MPALVEIDRDAAAGLIARACAPLPEVAAAYLFGSALGLCRPDSDIDVAIIRRGPANEGGPEAFRAGLLLEVALQDALGDMEGHPFEPVVLDEGQPLFAMTVLDKGRLCYVGDAEAYTDFLEHVAQGYRENAPRYRRALAEVLEEPLR